ncbi:putative COF1-cofilin [Basidiobolus meristosporus CBS 931.73]|uniref:Cofilin n=1 Tax=Basidiobolus meristosporus CBS 931.73 TaxID=1314790 RepID=A0A1Y1WU83_9FUNG|nr:putative COF1-cofilin [Basidiobolus meristosporus CBS 931.73]|eukprot:ORX76955.1 putative COF1-cofilin [Basidiobolus meristosporus CBS 931.73]
MSSGVSVNDKCLESFQLLKLKKQYKYIIYKLNDDNTEIIVEEASEAGTYDDFINALPETECRYAVLDLEYEKPGEGMRNKICFYAWSPDNSKVKQKMVFASSKDALRKRLVGIAAEIQGTDYDEVSFETVLEKVSRSTF